MPYIAVAVNLPPMNRTIVTLFPGFEIARAVERNPTDSEDKPIREVRMERTGVLPVPETGYWWDLDTPVGDCPY